MHALDKTAWEVLDATADDWENLEQIYQMVCLDFCAEGYTNRDRGAYYWRPAQGGPSLKEVADRLCELAQTGLLTARDGESGAPLSDWNDRSFVWRAWFQMTPTGRSVWESSEYATLAEQHSH